MSDFVPTAAILIIGNEILSGRTPDANLNFLAKKLSSLGVVLKEARVVLDVEADIVRAVNELRAVYTYVFTTGGIGATHDDITVDAVAAAFQVPVEEHPKAKAFLAAYFGEENLTRARLRMARVPRGADLIENPISAAPGVKIDNVFVFAGVPDIMQSMMDSVVSTLLRGLAIYSLTVSGFVAESRIAEDLRGIASEFPLVDIGSYPWMREDRFGTSLVVRGRDEVLVAKVADRLFALMEAFGAQATRLGG